MGQKHDSQAEPKLYRIDSIILFLYHMVHLYIYIYIENINISERSLHCGRLDSWQPRPSRTADEDPLGDAGWWSLFLFRRINLFELLSKVRPEVPRVTSTASTSFYWAVQRRVRMLQLKAPARDRLRVLLCFVRCISFWSCFAHGKWSAMLSHPFSWGWPGWSSTAVFLPRER